jgi:hypothetical protein
VLCRKITDANEDVVLYRTPNGYSYTGTATGSMYYKGCQNTGWVKGDLRLGYANSYYSPQYTAVIYSATIPLGQPPLTALNMLLCRGDFTTSTGWSNAVTKYNLQTLVNDPFLIGTIRTIAIYQGEDHIVFVSNENPPGNYSIALVPLYISAYAYSMSRQSNFITTYYNYSTTMNTHKTLMIPTIGSYINSGIYLVDSSKLYYNTILAQRDIVPYFYTISKIGNSTYRLDCGLDSMTGTQEVVPYMMFHNDNSVASSNSRITVVYRYLGNNTLFDYAFVISNTFDFICARPSGFAEGYAQHGFIHGYPPNSYYSSIKNSIMSMYDINTMSYLRVKAEAAAGRYSIPVSASTGGKNQVSPQLFSYDVFASLADITGTSLPTTTVTTYPGYKLLLPFTAPHFNTPAGKFSISATFGKVLHSEVVSFSNFVTLSSPPYTIIDRVQLIDNSTFHFILRNGMNEVEYIVFVTKTQSPTGQTVLNPPPTPTPIYYPSSQYATRVAVSTSTGWCTVYKMLNYNEPQMYTSCFRKTDRANTNNVGTPSGSYTTATGIYTSRGQSNNKIIELFQHSTYGYYYSSWPYPMLHMYGIVINNDNVNIPFSLPQSSWYGSLGFSSSFTIFDSSNCFMSDMILDNWGSRDQVSFATVKVVCKVKKPQAVLTKQRVTFDPDNNYPTFTLEKKLDVPNQDFVFCPTRREVIMYNWRRRKVWAQSLDRNIKGAQDSNMYSIPTSAFGIAQILQFLCLPEASSVQILGVALDGSRRLLTIRGGNSFIAGKRAHSIVTLNSNINFVDAITKDNYIMTMCSATGNASVERQVVYTFFNGPHFTVDNIAQTTNYNTTIQSTSAKNVLVASTVNVAFLTPLTFVTIQPQKKWINAVGTTFNLDDAINNQPGPIMDIFVFGDQTAVNVTKRITRFKSYNLNNSAGVPKKLIVRGDFIVTYELDKYLIVAGDPLVNKFSGATAPKLLMTLYTKPFELKGATLIAQGDSNAILVIVRNETDLSNRKYFKVDIHYLISSTVNGVTTYTNKSTYGLNYYKDKVALNIMAVSYVRVDAMIMQNKDIVVAYSNLTDRPASGSAIKLACYRSGDYSAFTVIHETYVIPQQSANIKDYFITTDGASDNAIVIATFHFSPYIGVAHWIPVSTDTEYVNNNNPPDTFLIESRVPVTHTLVTDVRPPNFFFVRCWNAGSYLLDCFMDFGDSLDGMFRMTLNSTRVVDPIVSIIKTSDIILPPGVAVSKVEKSGPYLAFVTSRVDLPPSLSNRRVLQIGGLYVVDDFQTCATNVLIFKPTYNSWTYTGVTCTEMASPSDVDISLLLESPVTNVTYLVFNKGMVMGSIDPAPIQVGVMKLTTPTVTITGAVTTVNFRLTFIGLRGTSSTENKACTLDDFLYIPPVTSTFPWMTVLLVTLAVLAAGGLGYLLFIWIKAKADSIRNAGYRRSENEAVEDRYGRGNKGTDTYHDELVDKKLIFL